MCSTPITGFISYALIAIIVGETSLEGSDAIRGAGIAAFTLPFVLGGAVVLISVWKPRTPTMRAMALVLAAVSVIFMTIGLWSTVSSEAPGDASIGGGLLVFASIATGTAAIIVRRSKRPATHVDSNDMFVSRNAADEQGSWAKSTPSNRRHPNAARNSMTIEATKNDKISVVIVDDHEMVSSGLQALIEDDPRMTVVARGNSATEGIAIVSEYHPDVVLMDYRLPDGNGSDAARTIRELDPPPAVLMVTSATDRRALSQALDAGCCGFLSKNASQDDLIEAICSAAEGDSYFTSDVLRQLVHLRRFNPVDNIELTDREIEVVQATANGASPDEIAASLYLSPHTIKNHLRHAMEKLDAHSKLEVVVKALQARLISIDD